MITRPQLFLCRNRVMRWERLLRPYSSGSSELIIQMNDKEGTGILKMKRPPVNSLDGPYLDLMSRTLTELTEDKCRGIIITSDLPKIFSAGLHIMEMYQQSEDYVKAFWWKVQEFFFALYSSPMATVAAINGACPAAGTLVALCCDYRVMQLPKYRIGLNESQLGLGVPFWLRSLMVDAAGERHTKLAIQLGTLFTGNDALRIGLVDDLSESEAETLEKAQNKLSQFIKIPAHARINAKLISHGRLLEEVRSRRKEDCQIFANFVLAEETQKTMGIYLQSLKK